MSPGASERPSFSERLRRALGTAGLTDYLLWIDALVQHPTGALRVGQWRKAWYPEAPIAPLALRAGGEPDAISDLIRMGPAQIQAMQMLGSTPHCMPPGSPGSWRGRSITMAGRC